MLTESFIAASLEPPKLTSSQSQQLKDAGIFCHSIQPQRKLDQVFKKSLAGPNRLAVNDSHIFVAQSGKAAVHVYSREKGNQEAILQFPEKLHCVTLALDGTVLVLGAEGGGLYLWEILTGRQVSTSQAHLQAVTAIAVDITNNYVLSASDDTNIHVWSLVDLSTLPSSAMNQSDTKTPVHTLTGHRGPITSVATGHSATSIDIALSASKDDNVMIWNYKSGAHLKTILLPSTPLCMTLDAGDRGLYIGLTDGTIQIIDFFTSSNSSSIYETSPTPLQPETSDRMSHSTSGATELGSTLSITLSFDSTTLLTGHSNGKILSWDVSRRDASGIVAEYPGAPITNLTFLPPSGFPNARSPRAKQTTIVKPRPNEDYSGPRGGHLTGTYTFSTQLFPSLDESATEFEQALFSPVFTSDMLEESIRDLTEPNLNASVGPAEASSNFISLGDHSAPTPAEEIASLKNQVAHLKKLQKISFEHVEKLVKEKNALLRRKEDEDRILAKKQRIAAENWPRGATNGSGDSDASMIGALGTTGTLVANGHATESDDEDDDEDLEDGDDAETRNGFDDTYSEEAADVLLEDDEHNDAEYMMGTSSRDA